MKNIIGLKAFRQNVNAYAERVQKGDSFIVMKKTKPLFKVVAAEEGLWEEIVDFTKIKKGGVDVQDLLSRL
jgi:antitoxin (DNA-binding transcriptional repressor) of toxin-antitoxin stability system